jgi:two-component system, cell cycle sensor histidine kinase and response regulator CckA
MGEENPTQGQLTAELAALRLRVAELERSEAESGRREEGLRLIAEHLGDIIWELNVNFEFTYVSPSVARLGYGSQDLLGKHLFSFLSPESIIAIRNILKPADGGDPPAGNRDQLIVELDFIDRQGNEVPMEVAPSARFSTTGELLCYQGVTRDISTRKRAEEALLMSRLQLSEALDLSRLVYWELDATSDELILNDPFYAFYGTSASREGGYRMAAEEYARIFVHPEDRALFARFREENRRSTHRDFRSDLEHRVLRRDGEVRYILARVSIIRDGAGNIVRFYGANQDVTERRQAEQALRESEERFRKIFEESRLGIVTVDSTHHFASANPAFCAMLGYTPDELSAITFEDVTHPDHAEEDRIGVGKLFQGRAPLYGTEKRYIRKDKEIVWGAATATVMRDGNGDFLYFLTMIEDISARKRAEEQRTKLEDQLRQAQKMEAIGTLAGGVAHDFNNLLTVILGFANLIQMSTTADDRVRPYADQIALSANKAAELTRSLLAFSRKQRINLGPHHVNEVIRSTAKLLRRLLPEDIELRLDLSPKEPVARLDVTQIDQVLMNLATNGRDAMPSGGLLLIQTDVVALDDRFREDHGFGSPGVYALLKVSDTGIGMDERTMARIFDPFFTTKEVGKGTGLGLASTYGIVKQHGGFITVSSELLKGTTFDIYLPVVDPSEPQKGAQAEKTRGGAETILVVEDDRLVRNMIMNILRPHGYTVLEAGNGDDALKVYRGPEQKVDLMLIDVVMPGKTGKELFDAVRAIDPRMRVIFMSGYTGDVVLDKGIESETVDFIPKPLSIPNLLAKIREVLDR